MWRILRHYIFLRLYPQLCVFFYTYINWWIIRIKILNPVSSEMCIWWIWNKNITTINFLRCTSVIRYLFSSRISVKNIFFLIELKIQTLSLKVLSSKQLLANFHSLNQWLIRIWKFIYAVFLRIASISWKPRYHNLYFIRIHEFGKLVLWVFLWGRFIHIKNNYYKLVIWNILLWW